MKPASFEAESDGRVADARAAFRELQLRYFSHACSDSDMSESHKQDLDAERCRKKEARNLRLKNEIDLFVTNLKLSKCSGHEIIRCLNIADLQFARNMEKKKKESQAAQLEKKKMMTHTVKKTKATFKATKKMKEDENIENLRRSGRKRKEVLRLSYNVPGGKPELMSTRKIKPTTKNEQPKKPSTKPALGKKPKINSGDLDSKYGFSSMLVRDLRKELKIRSLKTAGLKAALITRLVEYEAEREEEERKLGVELVKMVPVEDTPATEKDEDVKMCDLTKSPMEVHDSEASIAVKLNLEDKLNSVEETRFSSVSLDGFSEKKSLPQTPVSYREESMDPPVDFDETEITNQVIFSAKKDRTLSFGQMLDIFNPSPGKRPPQEAEISNKASTYDASSIQRAKSIQKEMEERLDRSVKYNTLDISSSAKKLSVAVDELKKFENIEKKALTKKQKNRLLLREKASNIKPDQLQTAPVLHVEPEKAEPIKCQIKPKIAIAAIERAKKERERMEKMEQERQAKREKFRIMREKNEKDKENKMSSNVAVVPKAGDGLKQDEHDDGVSISSFDSETDDENLKKTRGLWYCNRKTVRPTMEKYFDRVALFQPSRPIDLCKTFNVTDEHRKRKWIARSSSGRWEADENGGIKKVTAKGITGKMLNFWATKK